MREDFLNGVTPLACRDCFMEEAQSVQSMRVRFLETHKAQVAEVQKANTSSPIELKYAEIRFSNACNLSCRTCSADFSSQIAGKVIAPHAGGPKGLLEEIKQHLDSLDTIYFVGGEPLIHKEHYELLELLIENKKTNVTLHYDTNMTLLGLGSRSVLKLWKYFSHIEVSASIDGIGKRFDLIRPGSSWSKVEKNFRLIKLFLPHVRLKIQITVSALNVLDFANTANYLINEKIVSRESQITINVVQFPSYYHVRVLPKELKEKASASLISIKDQTNISGVDFLLSELNSEASQGQWEEFLKVTCETDRARAENTSETIPELKSYLQLFTSSSN